MSTLTRFRPILLLLVLVASCASWTHCPAKGGNDMEQTLRQAREAVAGGRVRSILTASCSESTGLEGASRITLDGGQVMIEEQSRDGTRRTFEGSLTEDEARALVEGAIEGRIWEARSTDPTGYPDEPRPRIRVAIDGRVLADVEGWRHELRNNEGYEAARDVLDRIAWRVSGRANAQ